MTATAAPPVEPAPPTPVDAPPRTRRLPHWHALLTVIALALVVALLVAQRRQLVSGVEALRHLDWWWIALAIALEFVSMAAIARLQRRMLRAGGTRLPLRSALGITYAGNAISVSLPLAGPEVGTLFAYRQFLRRGASQVTAVWAIIASGVVSSLAFTAVLVIGAMLSTNPAAATAGAVGTLTLVVPVVLLLVAIRLPVVAEWLDGVAVRLLRLVQRVAHRPTGDAQELVTRSRGEVSALHFGPSSWARVSVYALVNWLADVGCLAAALKAADLPVPGRALILIWAAGAAATTLNLTPGGLGVVEAAVVAGLVAAHLPTAGATTAVLAYRLISFWLVLAVGWLAYPLVQRQAAAVPDSAEPEVVAPDAA